MMSRQPGEPGDIYTARHREVFGREPTRSPDWIHFPFPWGSPEAVEVQGVIWKIESLLWRKFLVDIKSEGIDGAVVEFGVSAGNGLEQLIRYCEEIGLTADIYGFDSFEGLPAPSVFDLPFWKEGDFAAAYDVVANRLRTDQRSNVRLVRGWFADTLRDPAVCRRIDRIAFARIDCDLYEPASECLSFLENRLSNGAYLCFDDWTDDVNTGETKAFFEFCDRMKERYRFEHVCRISLGGMHMRVHHERQQLP